MKISQTFHIYRLKPVLCSPLGTSAEPAPPPPYIVDGFLICGTVDPGLRVWGGTQYTASNASF